MKLSAAIVLVLLSVALGGCDDALEVDTTLGPETERGEVSLAFPPDPSRSEVPLLVTSNRCSGGLIPAGIASVNVEEAAVSIDIDVWIELPEETWPTTCPPNPVLEVTAPLDAPLGARTVWIVTDRGLFQLWPPP